MMFYQYICYYYSLTVDGFLLNNIKFRFKYSLDNIAYGIVKGRGNITSKGNIFKWIYHSSTLQCILLEKNKSIQYNRTRLHKYYKWSCVWLWEKYVCTYLCQIRQHPKTLPRNLLSLLDAQIKQMADRMKSFVECIIQVFSCYFLSNLK